MQDAGRLEIALLAAVEIQHADAPLAAAVVRGLGAELCDLQRRTEHVPDAEGQRAAMPRCIRIVQQVAHDAVDTRGEHFVRDALARLRGGERDAAACPRETLHQGPARLREEDESALRAGELQRAVEHNRQHFVEHLPGPECAQPREERVHLPEVEVTGGEHARLPDLDAQFGISDTNAIAGLQRGGLHTRVVDEGAAA